MIGNFISIKSSPSFLITNQPSLVFIGNISSKIFLTVCVEVLEHSEKTKISDFNAKRFFQFIDPFSIIKAV